MRLRRIIVAFLFLVFGGLVTAGCVSLVTKIQRASEDCMLRNIEEACNYVYAVGTKRAFETKMAKAIVTEAAAEAEYDLYIDVGSAPPTSTKTFNATITPTPTPTSTPNPDTIIIP